MSATKHSTAGFRRITRGSPVRLAAFIAGVVLASLLITWINQDIGWQMGRLEEEFSAIESERFYVAVHMRMSVRKLNTSLLDYHLIGAEADRRAFLTNAKELKDWLSGQKSLVDTPGEERIIGELELAYAHYLEFANTVVASAEKKDRRPAAFAQAYRTAQAQSRPLLLLCDQLLEMQRRAFDSFLYDSQKTMRSLHRLLRISLGLLFGLAAALVVLAYRGMIAPLRRRLSESEAIILRQEKLASLGVLAAGVAHEIRNPLTAIKLRLFSFKKALPPELAGHEDARVIGEEINRLDRIVKDFLQFARPSEPALARTSALRILEDVVSLLKPSLEKSAIHLRVDALESSWLCADAHQLEQVLINIVQNAADSIGRNGTITLRLQRTTAQLAAGTQHAVILQVIDTGRGIPPEIENRLFDPFFSTKDGGTGLGLAIAARIVEKHGGVLRYRTTINQGTTFELVLPRLDD